MRVRRDRSRLAFVTAGAATLGVAAIRAKARPAQFEFKCGGSLAVDHPLSVRGRQMWETVERESGGRVHAEYFPADQLGTDEAQLTQVRVGALQFFQCPPGNASGVVPAADIVDLGFAFKDGDEALRAMDGPLGEFVRNEFAAKGFYALRRAWQSGMRQVTSSTRPMRTAEDFRGFKIRTAQAKISVGLFRALGASPVPMTSLGLYTALQTRVVDGATNPLVTIQAAHYYEVQKYLSLTNDSWSGMWMITSGDYWKSLPADLQDIIERNNTKYSLLERRDTKIVNASVSDKLAREGLIINATDPAAFRPLLSAYYAEWKEAYGPTEWSLLQNAISGKLT